jgi:hypothetical protein
MTWRVGGTGGQTSAGWKCRRRDSNPRHADYDAAAPIAEAFGCQVFSPLESQIADFVPLCVFGHFRVSPCHPLATLRARLPNCGLHPVGVRI